MERLHREGGDSEKETSLTNPDGSCYIIAEVGSNHCGSLELARDHIRLAAKVGVNCVKFQHFKVDKLYPPFGTADYLGGKNLYDILKPYEVPDDWIPYLFSYALGCGIDFASTPFYLEAVELLEPYVKFFKIASFELTWHELIAKCAATGKPLILSTGGATPPEILEALRATGIRAIDHDLRDRLALLHCTSRYPAPDNQLNLNVIQSWIHGGYEGEGGLSPDLHDHQKDVEEHLNYPIPHVYGLSDHSRHPFAAACAAVAIGAKVIEKHVTISKDLDSPDASFAIDMNELAQMVSEVRRVETMLGSREKGPQEKELHNYRRVVYASSFIPAGEVIGDRVTALRQTGQSNIQLPGIIPASQIEYVKSKNAVGDILNGSIITKSYLE